MTLKHLGLILCAGLWLATGCTQPEYLEPSQDKGQQEVTDGTSRPSMPPHPDAIEWSDPTGAFTFYNDGSVQLTAPDGQAGEACLISEQTQLRTTRWQFDVKLSFNPSANNYLRIYLTSTEADVSLPLNGYYLQVGGEKDQVCLCRQEGTQHTVLLESREWMKGDKTPDCRIYASCDSQGYFIVEVYDYNRREYVFSKMVRDETFTTSAYCVVQCVYTKSRNRGFRLISSQRNHRVTDVHRPEPIG